VNGAQHGRVLAVLVLALLTAGCGLKGNLYLEEPPVASSTDAADASASTAQPEPPKPAATDAPQSAAESFQENSSQEKPSQEKQ
jgi:predicted small lipoprotein YifL